MVTRTIRMSICKSTNLLFKGLRPFEQYLDNWGGSWIGSNRQVTTGNHFNHWNSIGMKLGTFNEMISEAEAHGGRSGYVNATTW